MIIFLIQKTRAKSNYSESCFMPQKVARKMAQKRLFVQKQQELINIVVNIRMFFES